MLWRQNGRNLETRPAPMQRGSQYVVAPRRAERHDAPGRTFAGALEDMLELAYFVAAVRIVREIVAFHPELAAIRRERQSLDRRRVTSDHGAIVRGVPHEPETLRKNASKSRPRAGHGGRTMLSVRPLERDLLASSAARRGG